MKIWREEDNRIILLFATTDYYKRISLSSFADNIILCAFIADVLYIYMWAATYIIGLYVVCTCTCQGCIQKIKAGGAK